MNNSYVKLFGDLVLSSVWQQSDPVRILWITMLALADRDGIVRGSVLGLANTARIELKECEAALKQFMEPDKYSRNGDHEGRRIEKHEHGWRILNHGIFRERMSADDRREYQAKYQRERRAKMKDASAVYREQE